MPYPVHALQLGEVMCRDFLGPDYDVFEVWYVHRGMPWMTKTRIYAGTLESKPCSLHKSGVSYSINKRENWQMGNSLLDMNVQVNNYNDHCTFIDWHRAVQYMIQCYKDSIAQSEERLEMMMQQAQKFQPTDGKIYLFSVPRPKPVNEGMNLGDILEAALKRRAVKPKVDYFGARWGISR